MLSVLMTAFLSFSSVSGNVLTEKSEPQPQNQISCYSAEDGYIPTPTISYGKYDNYWWGNYEVDGSRSAYYTYIALKPFITVGFEDGSFVG